jgi:hypothetical protein
VAEYLSTHAGTSPSDVNAAGCSTTQTQYVASLAVSGTPPLITGISRNTGASPGECTLSLKAVFATGDTVTVATWWGTHGTCAAKYVPSTFR